MILFTWSITIFQSRMKSLWAYAEKCELVCMRENEKWERKSRTSHKSFKNYSRIIAQLTFSIVREILALFFTFFNNKMNSSVSPLNLLQHPPRSKQSEGCSTRHTVRIPTTEQNNLVLFLWCDSSPYISSLCLRWPYLWLCLGEGPEFGLKNRTAKGTIQSEEGQGEKNQMGERFRKMEHPLL